MDKGSATFSFSNEPPGFENLEGDDFEDKLKILAEKSGVEFFVPEGGLETMSVEWPMTQVAFVFEDPLLAQQFKIWCLEEDGAEFEFVGFWNNPDKDMFIVRECRPVDTDEA